MSDGVKNTLILMVGLPRSGKSTWAKSQNFPIVNLDSIRLAVHGQRFWGPAEPIVSAHAQVMVSSLFLAGNETVILDATNVSRHRRTHWYCRKDTPAQWLTVAKHIDTSYDECRARAIAEEDQDILPVIARMGDAFDYYPASDTWDEPTPEFNFSKTPIHLLEMYERQLHFFD